ncbi:hypothetical protein MTO96_025820 [Rhipicephalus appendiculatus]
MEIDNYCFQQSGDSPDLEFVYDDADSHENEIAELYTYTEEAEFFLNKKAFEDTMKEYGFEPKWHTLDETTRQDVTLRLMDGVEVSPRAARMQAVRSILYIMQGAFGECTTLEEQPHRARQNVFLLYRHGFFHVFLQLLNMEIENSSAATSALRKPAVSLGDSTDLRAILSVLYIFVEVMRVSAETDTDDMKRDRANFASELVFPSRLIIIIVLHLTIQKWDSVRPEVIHRAQTCLSLATEHLQRLRQAKKMADGGAPTAGKAAQAEACPTARLPAAPLRHPDQLSTWRQSFKPPYKQQ